MIEALLQPLHAVWQPHLEVVVTRPARGVIDAVFEHREQPLLVISEFESALPRLEQQIRWASEKAASIASSPIVGDTPPPPVSRLLVLRSTAATRTLANEFESTLRAAYPARSRDALASLWTGSPWPGAAIIWVRIDGNRVVVLDQPPRGVALGR